MIGRTLASNGTNKAVLLGEAVGAHDVRGPLLDRYARLDVIHVRLAERRLLKGVSREPLRVIFCWLVIGVSPR